MRHVYINANGDEETFSQSLCEKEIKAGGYTYHGTIKGGVFHSAERRRRIRDTQDRHNIINAQADLERLQHLDQLNKWGIV